MKMFARFAGGGRHFLGLCECQSCLLQWQAQPSIERILRGARSLSLCHLHLRCLVPRQLFSGSRVRVSSVCHDGTGGGCLGVGGLEGKGELIMRKR